MCRAAGKQSTYRHPNAEEGTRWGGAAVLLLLSPHRLASQNARAAIRAGDCNMCRGGWLNAHLGGRNSVMASVQTSLSHLRSGARSQQFHQIAGSRKHRHGVFQATAQPDASAAASPAASPEWALIQQAIAGNFDSQNFLFAAYTSRLYRTAFAVLHNREDAEDAVQDGLCNAHIHLRSFQGRSSFGTWLTRIVVNSALMIRRRQSIRAALPLHEIVEHEQGSSGSSIADIGPNPEEICRVTEFDRLLAAEVGRLPATLQTAFQLREVDGLSIEESSRKLGIGKGAFKSRIMRARRKVTRALNKSLKRSLNGTLDGTMNGSGRKALTRSPAWSPARSTGNCAGRRYRSGIHEEPRKDLEAACSQG